MKNGITEHAIDFDALYAWLDAMMVTLPEGAAGEPISPREIARYLIIVQNRRVEVDRVLMTLERRVGLMDRRLEVAKERARLARTNYASDPILVRLPKSVREASVNRRTQDLLGAVSKIKSDRSLVEAAVRAVKSHIDTLETAKQTLNALRQLSEDQPMNDRQDRSRRFP